MSAYFERGYVPDGVSIFAGVSKVQPGEAWCFTSPPVVIRGSFDIISGSLQALLGAHNLISAPREAVKALAATIDSAVERQLVADVPVGVFLSGGIDSSTCRRGRGACARGSGVKTFCIGFHDPRYDESSGECERRR